MAAKTKTVSDFEKQGYTQVFGNFSSTDVIEVLATTSPKKANTKAARAYEKMLEAYSAKSAKKEPFTVGDSVEVGNAGFRIKWDADPEREFVRVWRKTA